MDLHAVEACFLDSQRCGHEIVCDAGDVGLRHDVRKKIRIPEPGDMNGAGRQGRSPDDLPLRGSAGVIELGDHRNAAAVDAVRETGHALDIAVPGDRQLPGACLPFRADKAVFSDDEAETGLCHFMIVGAELRRDPGLIVPFDICHGRQDHPVFQFQTADPERSAEQVHGATSFSGAGSNIVLKTIIPCRTDKT